MNTPPLNCSKRMVLLSPEAYVELLTLSYKAKSTCETVLVALIKKEFLADAPGNWDALNPSTSTALAELKAQVRALGEQRRIESKSNDELRTRLSAIEKRLDWMTRLPDELG